MASAVGLDFFPANIDVIMVDLGIQKRGDYIHMIPFQLQCQAEGGYFGYYLPDLDYPITTGNHASSYSTKNLAGRPAAEI